MKVAVFDFYRGGADLVESGNDRAVAVVLSEKDRENIANMVPGATVYASFPDAMDRDDILERLQSWLDDLKRLGPG